MTKVQIKSEKLTPFGGIFSIMEQFDSTLSSVIDSTLGLRCGSFGYQYSEIIRPLMSIYFSGGSCTSGCHYSFDEPSLASSDTLYFCRGLMDWGRVVRRAIVVFERAPHAELPTL